MDSLYDPSGVERRWQETWEAEGLYGAGAGRRREDSFVICVPPPNVTGELHMGHALNGAMQDVLVRWHRMRGFDTLWQPGYDHAGISTQNVVEKQLVAEGTSRQEIGREAFVERTWDWLERTGRTIMGQYRRLGASLDYSRERFTMDDEYVRAVMTFFVRLWERGWIYRANRIVNWCPYHETAISDLEVEHVEKDDTLYRIVYPFSGGQIAFGDGGLIYLGGYYSTGNEGANFAVQRFLDSGAQDNSFDSDSYVQTAFTGPLADQVRHVTVRQDDGKILVVGQTSGGTTEMVMARYLPTGQLDPAFGTGGIARTGVIGAFVEGFREPARLHGIAARARSRGKPIVALKVGRSEVARSAAMAHTASVVGSAEVAEAALRKAGVIQVSTLNDLLESLALLSLPPGPDGHGPDAAEVQRLKDLHARATGATRPGRSARRPGRTASRGGARKTRG